MHPAQPAQPQGIAAAHPGAPALPHEPGRVAAFFDLDKTIIATSSAFAFGKGFMDCGLISPAAAFNLSLSKASYMVHGHTSEQMDSTRDQLTAMVAGWPVERVREIARDCMQTAVTPAIYAEARELIDAHKSARHTVVIVSASAEILVELIAAELGIDEVVATQLEEDGGLLTGNVLFYCKGAAKAEAIAEIARERGIDLGASFAYSDSATDIPMLDTVGNPVAVNPDRHLKKHAFASGWDVRSFRDPIPLIGKPGTKEVSIGASVIAGIAVVAGILWAQYPQAGWGFKHSA